MIDSRDPAAEEVARATGPASTRGGRKAAIVLRLAYADDDALAAVEDLLSAYGL